MFECHITLDNPNKLIAEEIARDFHWKTSEIERDPVLGNNIYYYLTTHSKDYESIFKKMKDTSDKCKSTGLNVVREKIEHIVYDTKVKI